MSETKWTPGNWRVENCMARGEGFAVASDHEFRTREGKVWKEYVAQYCKEPTAHLIAAAPDLYAALEDIVLQYAPYSDAQLEDIAARTAAVDTGQPMSKHWAEKMIAARAALKKARGES